MKKIFGSSFAIIVLVTIWSCSTSDSEDSDDTTNTELAAMASTLGDSINPSAEIRTSTTAAGRHLRECPDCPFAACDTATKTMTRVMGHIHTRDERYPCTRGTDNGFRVYGDIVLTFSDSACDYAGAAAGATVIRTVSGHYVQNGEAGRRVLMYTGTGTVADKTLIEADLMDFEGTSRSGGATMTKGASSDTLAINGIHRRGLTAAGRYTFHHTLYTESGSPLTITRSRGDSTVSGTVYLMHNRVSRKVTKTLNNVLYNATCRHPVSGSIDFAFANASLNFTITFTSTCGTGTIGSDAVNFENTES